MCYKIFKRCISPRDSSLNKEISKEERAHSACRLKKVEGRKKDFLFKNKNKEGKEKYDLVR